MHSGPKVRKYQREGTPGLRNELGGVLVIRKRSLSIDHGPRKLGQRPVISAGSGILSSLSNPL